MMISERELTKRLTPTQLACVSRQDVHWTLNVYKNGASSVSAGRKLVTLYVVSHVYIMR